MDNISELLNQSDKKVLVCVDWANVHNWNKNVRLSRVEIKKQEIDPQKLFNYLKSFNGIKTVRLFYGYDKADDTVVDNITRWVTKKTHKKPRDLRELIDSVEKLISKGGVSYEMMNQIQNVLDEYYSAKRISALDKIGYDLETKPVKNWPVGLTDLPKFRTITQKTKQIIDEIITEAEENSAYLDEEFLEKLKSLRSWLNQKIKYRKCDFDVEITVEMIKNIDRYDIFVIVSGDGDYSPLIKYIREAGKEVVVFARSNKLGREISELDGSHKPFIIRSEEINKIWRNKRNRV